MDPLKPDLRAIYTSLRRGGLTDEQARAQLQSYNLPMPPDLDAAYAAVAPAVVAPPAAVGSEPVPFEEPAPAPTPQSYGVERLQNHLSAVALLLGPRFAQWARVTPEDVESAVSTVLSVERTLLGQSAPHAAITRVEGLAPVKPAPPIIRPHPLSLSLQPPAPPAMNQPVDPYPHVAITDASATNQRNHTPVALPASVNVTPAIGANPSMARHGV